MLKIFSSEDRIHEINLDQNGKVGTVNGKDFSLDMIELEPGRHHLLYNNKSYNLELLSVDRDEKRIKVVVNGELFEMNIKDRFDDLLQQLGMDMAAGKGEKQVKAPMPGLVLDILVQAGDQVEKGSPLLILEAMKMENVIKAAADGIVSKISAVKGNAVEKNEILIEFSA
jgi:biotin carboxyl carrier protein